MTGSLVGSFLQKLSDPFLIFMVFVLCIVVYNQIYVIKKLFEANAKKDEQITALTGPIKENGKLMAEVLLTLETTIRLLGYGKKE